MDGALRAIERLDGFIRYNYKVRVYLARNQYRRSHWSNPDSSKSSFKKAESIGDLEKTYSLFKENEQMQKAKSEFEAPFKRLFKRVSKWLEEVGACDRQAWIACQ
ncbi:hypothetical protein V6N11_021877 [Hibiscus sabdariffa]|uniref:Uncharacterized protein n=1 Tax=Hibiscus sabdariffa TaxID=183260 RepID=A0ABR2TIA9_9ROSI